MTPFGIHTDVRMYHALHCHQRIIPSHCCCFFYSLCLTNKLIIFALHNKRILKPGLTNMWLETEEERNFYKPQHQNTPTSFLLLCSANFKEFLHFWIQNNVKIKLSKLHYTLKHTKLWQLPLPVFLSCQMFTWSSQEAQSVKREAHFIYEETEAEKLRARQSQNSDVVELSSRSRLPNSQGVL